MSKCPAMVRFSLEPYLIEHKTTVTKLPGITLNHCSVQQLLHLLPFKVVLLLNSGPVLVVGSTLQFRQEQLAGFLRAPSDLFRHCLIYTLSVESGLSMQLKNYNIG